MSRLAHLASPTILHTCTRPMRVALWWLQFPHPGRLPGDGAALMSEQGLWCQTHLGLGPDPAAAQLRELGPPVSSSAEGGAPGPWEGSSRGPSPVSGPCGRPGRTKLGRASWVRRQLWPRACAAGNIVWEPGKHGASLHRLSPDLLCRALRSWGHGVALFASRWPQHGLCSMQPSSTEGLQGPCPGQH